MTVRGIIFPILALAVLTGSSALVSACSRDENSIAVNTGKQNKIVSDGKDYSVSALNNADTPAAATSEENALASVGDHETLLKLLLERGALYDAAAASKNSGGILRSIFGFDVADEAMPEMLTGAGAAPAPAPEAAGTGSSADDSGGTFSQTNEQVEGVSEGDLIKTDGEYIYTMLPGNNEIRIIKAEGAALETVSKIIPENLNGAEFYLTGKQRLVIIGNWHMGAGTEPRTGGAEKGFYDDMFYSYGRSLTVAVIYDITDKSAPSEVRRVSMEGYSIANRIIGDTLYMVSNKHIWGVPYEQADSELILPYVCDTGADGVFEPVAYEKIYIIPDTQDTSYMLIGALNISGDEAFEPDAYFGAAGNLYMNHNAMYITNTRWVHTIQTPVQTRGGMTNDVVVRNLDGPETDILRFAIDGTGVTYTAAGTASGEPVNQYSMDEYGGYLRIATTQWNTGTFVTVFDTQTMTETGRAGPLAPGELMRSMRFMGDMGYVVTFENTDPLFTVDLTDPHNPKVLGELKIPGFSQYLHPAGDGLLLGIGRDTQELFTRDANGKETVVGFRDVGMKVSLFDVSDPFNPAEINVLPLGDCWAEVSHNPRALTADAARGIYGFIAESWGGNPVNGYGMKDGAFAVMLRVENRKLSIEAALDIIKNDGYGYYYGNGRICYIGDVLYTVSAGGIIAYDYNTYEKLGELDFWTDKR